MRGWGVRDRAAAIICRWASMPRMELVTDELASPSCLAAALKLPDSTTLMKTRIARRRSMLIVFVPIPMASRRPARTPAEGPDRDSQ